MNRTPGPADLDDKASLPSPETRPQKPVALPDAARADVGAVVVRPSLGEWRADRRAFLILCGLLILLFAPLYSTQWLPGGSDDAFYLSVARSFATGHGFTSENGPVGDFVPPGWPWLIARLMKISAAMALINAVPWLTTLIGSSIWYFPLRRYTTRGGAVATVLICATLFWWFRSAMHLYSEGPFMLLLPMAFLLCLQINERRPALWRILALALICFCMVMVRWPGLLAMPLLCGAAVRGQMGWKRPANIVAACMIALSLGATFLITKHIVRQEAQKLVAESGDAAAIEALQRSERREERMLSGVQKRFLDRIAISGSWVTVLFVPAAEMGGVGGVSDYFESIFGWLLIACWAWRLRVALKRLEWEWLGVLGVLGFHMLFWARPTGRYLVPLAPMFFVGIVQGIRLFCTSALNRPRLARVAAGMFAIAVVCCNAPAMLISGYFAHAAPVSQHWLGGEFDPMISAANYLRDHNIQDGELASNMGCAALQKTRNIRFVRRIFFWLTGKTVQSVPGLPRPLKLTAKEKARLKAKNALPSAPPFWDAPGDGPQANLLVDWAKQNGVRFYLYRFCDRPATVWHFRKTTVSKSAATRDAQWLELWELKGDHFELVDLAPNNGVRRVPEM